MELQARMVKLLKASPEALEMIDAILDGRNVPQAKEHMRLMTIAECPGQEGHDGRGLHDPDRGCRATHQA